LEVEKWSSGQGIHFGREEEEEENDFAKDF
jgi:hypothetical protein